MSYKRPGRRLNEEGIFGPIAGDEVYWKLRDGYDEMLGKRVAVAFAPEMEKMKGLLAEYEELNGSMVRQKELPVYSDDELDDFDFHDGFLR